MSVDHPFQLGKNGVDGDPNTRAQIEGLVVPAGQREHVGSGNVIDVDVIAFLLPASVDHRLHAAQYLAGEDRDDTGFAEGVLPRSVHVRISEGAVREAIDNGVDAQVELKACLARPIGISWNDRMALA